MSKYLAVLPLAALLFVSACGSEADKTAPKSAATATAPASNASTAPSYDATPADGIDFSREGYPKFVRAVNGVSGREDFGRWTEGANASFTFADPLPKAFTLTIETIRAFGPNAGKRLRVKAGSWSGEADLAAEAQTLKFAVASSAPVDTIQLEIPAPASPQQSGESGDTRMLGVALKRLTITTP